MDNAQVDKEPVAPGENTPVTADESEAKQPHAKSRKDSEASVKETQKAKLKGKVKIEEKKQKKKAKKEKDRSSSDDSSDSSDSDESSDDDLDSSSSESESEYDGDKKSKRKLKAKKKTEKEKQKKKDKAKEKKRRAKESDTSDSDSDADEEISDDDDEAVEDEKDSTAIAAKIAKLQLQQQMLAYNSRLSGKGGASLGGSGTTLAQLIALKKTQKGSKKEKGTKKKRASKISYKRVDQLWDNNIHAYKLTDTVEDETAAEYDQYLFNVRRTFDWEGKYKRTFIDIKSKLIKEGLRKVMDGVKGISLVEETPAVDPQLLFLYLEDLRKWIKSVKKAKSDDDGKKLKKKQLKKNKDIVNHTKVLVKYLDKDFAGVKTTLYPMLDSGLATFDLLWALFKPNTICFTTTYGTTEEPRAFKIDYANKESSFMKGEWYCIEGKYLEYDGKVWGMGSMEVDVGAFKGARKISSLACFPLKYHKEEAKIRKQLIARGKKFVSLQGVHYKSHEGLAYYKKKRQIVKVNINGRIMVDPAIHRRMLPNYQISTVKPKDPDLFEDSEEEPDSDDCCGCGSDSENDGKDRDVDATDEPRTRRKLVRDEKDKLRVVEVQIDENGDEIRPRKLADEVDCVAGEEKEAEKNGNARADKENKKSLPVFTDEEYLVASPVVLGFAFGEKTWLEFTVSGVKEIVWNEGAYESLVLENNTKDVVKALVESHKFNRGPGIDVIQGKGNGLVAVLHGPPGTGKTLTAEGIAELLKCPLYMVTAGELGTDSRALEQELEKVLNLAHAWGAVLLLDEADVFLEKRTIQDIHRNALVSVFLRLLEYFQGILFLTTNRVETFDDAFQSRIHIALRYGELTPRAKKSVFKMFIERVRVQEGAETMPFTDDDFTNLAKHTLNGRQIKNTVRTAQALAVNRKEPLSMVHIQKVLDVALAFDRDLKGGTGFEDAMRNYY